MIHTNREDIETDLTTDGELQSEVAKFLLERFDHLGTDLCFLMMSLSDRCGRLRS
jgi:hypothetical protein